CRRKSRARSEHRGERHARLGRHSPIERFSRARSGRARDSQAREPLRSFPGRACARIPRVAVCLRVAVRRRTTGGRHGLHRSLTVRWSTYTSHMAGASLANHLLIAMPSLADPNFAQTVTLICEHTDKGALGIVLNKPLPMKLLDVLSQMKLEPRDLEIAAKPVLRGGPMSTDRGFVLHRPGGNWDHTHKVSDLIQVTTSRDVLAAMARGEGPSDAFIALGYAGWESGQLEREMRENAWMTLPADVRMVFELPFEERWEAAWRSLGIDVARLSSVAGHA